ncbi:formyl transferase [Magnetospirillum sp. ME-1]|uniref:formyl transferase n=1 Tax=Magnetospirillum sp. ME-1 TaxID=1639348 RepID=UPI0011AE2D49|nr:formyl transferase [Magnetospirillum sp. ME-1]
MNPAQPPLRILVCTKMDLAGALILNTLLPHLAGDTVTVLMSEKTRPVENTVPELAEIKFHERDLPMDILFPLIDRAEAKGAPLLTFAGLAARYGITIESISDLNGPEGEARIRAFAPDLTISARFSLIFKPNTYEIPRLGTYNVHPGALPRYAGLFAPFRCMLDGSDSIGCTLHRVDKGIDTGPIVGIGYLPVDRNRSLLWHVVNTYRPGLDLFLAMLARLRQGLEPQYEKQDFSLRQYGSLPGPEPFADFKAKGLKLFEPAEYLEILSGFLPPDMAMPSAVAKAVANGRGDACCSVPA